MSKYRVLWQSSTVIKEFPDYQRAIETHAKKVMAPDFELVVCGVERGTSEIHFMAFDFLNNTQLFDSVRQAEMEGYDGVAIGCFFDPLLDELREITDIPVTGLGESAMLSACMLGKRFSVISYIPQNNVKLIGNLIHKYGFSERVAPSTSFSVPLDELARGFRQPAPVVERFKEAAERAVKQGAEVLLPGCGVLNLILMNANVSEVAGATVLDVSGALMKLTEMMIILRKFSGTKTSRVGYYEAPPKELVDEVCQIYGRKTLGNANISGGGAL